MKRRLVALMLTVLTVVGMVTCVPAHAAAEPRASEYFASTGVFAYAKGNGRIKIEVDVAATHEMLEVGASIVHIYEQNADGTSTRVATFRKADNPYMVEHDSFFAYIDVYYDSAIPGRQYYAIVGCFAMNSAGSEILYFTSNLVTAT